MKKLSGKIVRSRKRRYEGRPLRMTCRLLIMLLMAAFVSAQTREDSLRGVLAQKGPPLEQRIN
ncbi:hypothetical protein HF324_03485 [Chitinophaga oryzae]|uniref:Uncharacterized protein n=1 Tax=Chitinophaga oryzae TaxID=2725414 RepID=A0AAE6ZEM2_9BACT|nr:hypothetical protein [Chitinophaga oryzae]QJB30457.1 hypothetical protein HF329_03725 [Chitinophaga oryzae]QJB36967.1 hypothetical protein HF324_03485 [Chitinophaga oryzae]